MEKHREGMDGEVEGTSREMGDQKGGMSFIGQGILPGTTQIYYSR